MAGEEMTSTTTGSRRANRRPLLAGGLLVGVNLADLVATWPLVTVDNFVILTRTAIHRVDITGWVWLHIAIAASGLIAGLLAMSYGRRWVIPLGIVCAAVAVAVGLALLPYTPYRSAFVVGANAAAIRLLVRHGRSRPPG
jgi:hypothetical protein